MAEYRSRPRDEATEKIECYMMKNQLEPHTKLPSERDLCEMWGMNRTTLRSAIKRLIVEGKLYNKKGSGTYVAESKIVRNLQDLQSITELITINQKKLKSKVLSFAMIPCNKQISRKLHIPIGTKIYELVRTRYMNEEPLMVETSYLSVEKFPNLFQYDFSEVSLYNVIENEYGVSLLGGEEKIGITYTSAEEAGRLNVKEDTAVFFVKGITWSEAEEPVEYFLSLVRADRIKFSSILKR